MATTALDLVKAALRSISVIATGEAPTAAEGADGLSMLNDMLALLSAEGLLVPAVTVGTGTLVSGQSSYTIGTSGAADWANARPLEITDLFIRNGSTDYGVDLIGPSNWAQTPLKTTSAMPSQAWYNLTAPDGTLQFNHPPSLGDTAYYNAIVPLQRFAALSDAVTLAPETLLMVRSNLACMLAPEYEREPSMMLLRMAEESKRALVSRIAASQSNVSPTDFIGSVPGSYNIDTG